MSEKNFRGQNGFDYSEHDYSERVHNEGDARLAAKSEKPLRDAARELKLTKKERQTLDKAAELRGQDTLNKLEAARKYSNRLEINGLTIVVKWNQDTESYRCSFTKPNITIRSEKYVDQINYDERQIDLGADEETAKFLFENISNLIRGLPNGQDNERAIIDLAKQITRLKLNR